MRILHVTECYEGGVRRAIDTMVRLTPEFEHFLMADRDQLKGHGIGLAGTIPMAKGFLKRASQVDSVCAEMEIDIVHAHSSWAGVYARVGRINRPVVYEPHCFVFDDPHRPRLQKWAYRKAEIALGRKTSALIALTPHEQALATQVISPDKIVWLPNVPSISVNLPRKEPISTPPEVVMIGRLARQKDPGFFASLYEGLKTEGIDTKFTWIGDGDESYRKMLTARGVEVTGWLNDEALIDRLSAASLYFHSASYEGFPLSVLDAAQAGLPILVRNLSCFNGFPISTTDEIQDAVNKVGELLSSTELQKLYMIKNDQLLTVMNPEAQRASLHRAYEIASGTRKEMYECV